jgi:hypothetical protein
MEVKIVRYETIIVKDATPNSYGDLVVNGGIKVKKKDLHQVFQVGAEVKIGYALFKNDKMKEAREYVATAEQTGKHEVPKDTSLVEAAKSIGAEVINPPPLKGDRYNPKYDKEPAPQTSQSVTLNDKMSKNDWDEKDRHTRKSIERQKALELACNVTKLDANEKIILTARRFEIFLETGG